MEENSRYVGRCLFCHLGDESKRGVLESTTTTKTLFENVGEKRYSCALGEVGKDCIIPEIFKRAYEASQVGRRGDDDATMRRTPIA
ncbi:MAG: hypothetical protein AABY16_01660 [Nanoarchaeota archaeon]